MGSVRRTLLSQRHGLLTQTPLITSETGGRGGKKRGGHGVGGGGGWALFPKSSQAIRDGKARGEPPPLGLFWGFGALMSPPQSRRVRTGDLGMVGPRWRGRRESGTLAACRESARRRALEMRRDVHSARVPLSPEATLMATSCPAALLPACPPWGFHGRDQPGEGLLLPLLSICLCQGINPIGSSKAPAFCPPPPCPEMEPAGARAGGCQHHAHSQKPLCWG